jgi:HNH endonuclease
LHPTCIYCGQEITAENDSDEHMISAAIGGRRTVRGFLHLTCNNKAGHTWDAALEKQLRPLALHFGVKRQSGQTLRMAITTTAGEAFLLGSGGTLEIARPAIKRTRTADGEKIQVVAGSLAMARQVLEGEKRKNPHIDVDATLASAEVRRSYAQGAIHLNLGFGGELSGRSLVKSALALAHDAGIPINQCGDALKYLRQADGEPCFGYYYVHDLVANRPADVPLHCVAIKATPASGLILGYVEFFGVHRAVVCLGRGYTGEAVESVYALDPRSGAELELSVRLAFDEADIKAIYSYERDDAAGRQNAFAKVFGPVLRAHQESERNRVFQESLQYAWANCGAEPDALLTAGDFANIRRLFADRATPWLRHVTGYTEEAARRQALAFIDLVLRSA